ncbi:MAG: hypothetical protein FWG29_10205 [Treponema sp.]|nr:hypothetical protein [Treponema sp.]
MKIKLFILCFSFFTIYFSPAQELAFPPKINLFQYSASISQRPLYGFPNARIWGWSNNGKVAYSIETEVDGRGGQKIDFVVFDLISDETIFELKMDSFNHNDVEDEILYNLFSSDIANALRINGIISQRIEFLPFPIRINNTVYNSQIINVEHKKGDEYGFFDSLVSKYMVKVIANEKSKIIANFNPVHTLTGYAYVCGYFLSPFENRALVVVAEEHWGFEGTELTYRFSGCHLGVGFN